MITPVSGSITQPAKTYNGVWILNIQISAPSPTALVAASIAICPFDSTTGDYDNTNVKYITIPDVFSLMGTDTNVATTIGAIYAYVQSQVTAQALF